MKRYIKLFIVLLLSISLLGCEVSKETLPDLVKDTIEDAVTSEIASEVNMNSGMISYYLKPNIGHPESYECNEVFLMDGQKVVLNVDVASIVSRKYYQSATAAQLKEIKAFENVLFEQDGAFTTATNIVRSYRYQLYEINEEYYGILLQTSNIIMIATAPIGDVVNITFEMFSLLRTVRVDEEIVASTYSQKELINYQKESLDIFEKIYPESGTLQDMFSDEEE